MNQGKWLASWFQAVAPRTAGFNAIPIDRLKDATTSVILVLMFIGGGSMSTASGIKVVTFMVLILSTYGYLQKDEGAIYVFKREISKETVSKALALTLISIVATWLGIFGLLLSENAPMVDIIFEAVSALGTVGLSRGLTSSLSESGEFIIMLLMFMGRLGPPARLFFSQPPNTSVKIPETKLAIG
ncbi:potassium transporter TrkG [Vibrio sp. PP-XX7]